jgi:hypothetical protein
MKVERWSVDADIRDWCYGLDRCGRYQDCRPRQFRDHDVQLRPLRAAHRDRHGVLARVAGVRLQRRKTVVLRLVVVVVVGYR